MLIETVLIIEYQATHLQITVWADLSFLTWLSSPWNTAQSTHSEYIAIAAAIFFFLSVLVKMEKLFSEYCRNDVDLNQINYAL